MAALYERREAVRAALSQVTLGEEEKARRIEFLNFQLEEIERPAPPGKRGINEGERAVEQRGRSFSAASAAYSLLLGVMNRRRF